MSKSKSLFDVLNGIEDTIESTKKKGKSKKEGKKISRSTKELAIISPGEIETKYKKYKELLKNEGMVIDSARAVGLSFFLKSREAEEQNQEKLLKWMNILTERIFSEGFIADLEPRDAILLFSTLQSSTEKSFERSDKVARVTDPLLGEAVKGLIKNTHDVNADKKEETEQTLGLRGPTLDPNREKGNPSPTQTKNVELTLKSDGTHELKLSSAISLLKEKVREKIKDQDEIDITDD